MKRVDEMLKTLEEDFVEFSKNRQEQLIQYFYKEAEGIRKQLESIFSSLVDEKTDCIVISFLRSSYVTRSHKFRIAAYNGEPFLDEGANYKHYCLEFYGTAMEDMTAFESKLRKLYIRVLSSELEEVGRAYMDLLYQNTTEFFKIAVNSMEQIHHIHPVLIFFGEEMGDVVQIGMINENQ